MKNSPHRKQHIRKKSVRKAQTEVPVQHDEKHLTPEQKKHYLTSQESITKKAAKIEGHTSKRTSPSEEIEGTEPAHIHKESKHWIDRVQMQSISRGHDCDRTCAHHKDHSSKNKKGKK